jgi:hypothetical protein
MEFLLMRNVTDAQQSTLIGVVAKIPVAEARKVFLGKVERRLPRVGAVTDDAFGDIVNAALASFQPGAYRTDHNGAWRAWDYIDPTQTLKEAADAYVRQLAINRGTEKQVCWPPYPSRPAQPAEPVESYTRWAARVSPEEHRAAAAEWARFIGGDEAYERCLREEAERAESELVFDLTKPPPARPVPVVVDEVEIVPQDVNLAIDEVEEEPPSPYFSDWGAPGRDNRGRPLKSAYAEVSELSKRRGKRGGMARKLGDISKVFFK